MVFDTSLLNTQYYKIHIKGKVGQSKHPPLHDGVVDVEKGVFGLPSTMVANFTNIYIYLYIYIYIYIYTHTHTQTHQSSWLGLYNTPTAFLHKSRCPVSDIKQSNSEAPILELWEMCTPSLPLLLGPL